jgi:hypothetical protein
MYAHLSIVAVGIFGGIFGLRLSRRVFVSSGISRDSEQAESPDGAKPNIAQNQNHMS